MTSGTDERRPAVGTLAHLRAEPATGPRPDVVRVAIVGTPRTGNTWIRRVLSDALDLVEVSVHHPGDIDWAALPPRCIVQLHWPRTLLLERTLRDAAVQVISPARHPLDVLLSVLVFAQRDPSLHLWLGGGRLGDDETIGVAPSDPAFARWATGAHAAELLSLTVEWWQTPSTIRVRYEALSEDGASAFDRLTDQLGLDPVVPLAVARGANSPSRLRALSGGVHVWHARPGLWREALTWDVADELAAAHAAVFTALGYPLPRPGDLLAPTPWTPIDVRLTP